MVSLASVSLDESSSKSWIVGARAGSSLARAICVPTAGDILVASDVPLAVEELFILCSPPIFVVIRARFCGRGTISLDLSLGTDRDSDDVEPRFLLLPRLPAMRRLSDATALLPDPLPEAFAIFPITSGSVAVLDLDEWLPSRRRRRGAIDAVAIDGRGSSGGERETVRSITLLRPRRVSILSIDCRWPRS